MSSTATATRPVEPPPPDAEPAPPIRPRRRGLIRLAVVLLVMALIAGVVWLGYFSAALSARAVTVRGLHELSAEQVRAAAVVPLGRPMMRQDVHAIAVRAASLPGVQSASVARDWPNTIEITVVERRPLLALRQPDGYLIVDKFGVGYQLKPFVPDGVSVVDANPDDRPLLTDLGTVASALPGKLSAPADHHPREQPQRHQPRAEIRTDGALGRIVGVEVEGGHRRGPAEEASENRDRCVQPAQPDDPIAAFQVVMAPQAELDLEQ